MRSTDQTEPASPKPALTQGGVVELVERGRAAWKRILYPQSADFVGDSGRLSSTVILEVADCLRLSLDEIERLAGGSSGAARKPDDWQPTLADYPLTDPGPWFVVATDEDENDVYSEDSSDPIAGGVDNMHAAAIIAGLERLAGERGGEALEAAQGIEWFERTFGVPLGDMPGRVDVEQIRALAALAPQPLPGEKKE